MLGHLLRGGSPTTFDRLISLRFGAAAVRALAAGKSGVMVALDPPTVRYVPLAEATRADEGRCRSTATPSRPPASSASAWGTEGGVSVLESHVDPASAEFRETRPRAWTGSWPSCASGCAAARAGGGEEAVRRHREQGKLLVRERVEKLLDPGTPFLEIGALAAFGLYDGPGARRGPRVRHRPRAAGAR